MSSIADTSDKVRIGVEELAMAISLVGRAEIAKGLLYSAFGELAPDEERGRLLAAGHSLMARGLLAVQDGESRLEERLKHMVEVIAGPDKVMNYNLTDGKKDHTLAYYVKGKEVIEQSVQQGVIYTLGITHGSAPVVDGGLGFFGIAPKEGERFPEAIVPMSVLDRARGASNGALSAIFQEAGVPEPVAQSLAADFGHTEARGAAMLIQAIGQGQLTSDEGVLLMKSAKRTWLFPIFLQDGTPHARLVVGSAQTFRHEIERLLTGSGRGK